MVNTLLLQLLTLSLYTLFMGFCFCDGFKLHILKKLLWFSVFLTISIYTLKIKNEFDLVIILPIPTLLAILLCSYKKIKSKKENA
jgi:Mg2+/citrate symporter